ncbi:MAG TPA: hypothetical protein PKB02_15305, partial [Anaerohalosphaeraceae bacterium]|nr:hypothetical protein [Anaerohalosphaeraceae bacterium]
YLLCVKGVCPFQAEPIHLHHSFINICLELTSLPFYSIRYSSKSEMGFSDFFINGLEREVHHGKELLQRGNTVLLRS